jgi:sigma-B regulation protein RsbU (phosphoserine phosphatase)
VGYDIAGMSIPHHDGVGGDYYDYIQEPDGLWGLVIADVAGKGMQAALLMATLRAALLSEVAKQADLPTRAMALNALIRESSPIDKYATLVYARLHPETGRLISLNAGHNSPLVIRQDGSMQRLEAGGLMIGMYPDDMLCRIAEYEEEITQLYSGDMVLFYTDGVTETVNIDDEMYDEERLEELVKKLRHVNASEVCAEIYNSTLEFQGEAQRFDDLTLMVLKKK